MDDPQNAGVLLVPGCDRFVIMSQQPVFYDTLLMGDSRRFLCCRWWRVFLLTCHECPHYAIRLIGQSNSSAFGLLALD